MVVPLAGPDGIRQTVNADISAVQRAWNLRSAYVVAALNCLKPEHAGILEGYKSFITTHEKGLSRLNSEVEKEWRAKFGSGYKRARDSYTTSVYNYFALPPSLPRFCDAALEMSRESLLISDAELQPFAERNLLKLEAVFDDFFDSYEQYRVAVASWDAQYGALYGGMYGVRPAVRTNANYTLPVSDAGSGPSVDNGSASYGPPNSQTSSTTAPHAADPGFSPSR